MVKAVASTLLCQPLAPLNNSSFSPPPHHLCALRLWIPFRRSIRLLTVHAVAAGVRVQCLSDRWNPCGSAFFSAFQQIIAEFDKHNKNFYSNLQRDEGRVAELSAKLNQGMPRCLKRLSDKTPVRTRLHL